MKTLDGAGEVYLFKDLNGSVVTIRAVELIETLTNEGFTLFGMTLPVILRLKKIYEMQAGPMPMTPETVSEVLEK